MPIKQIIKIGNSKLTRRSEEINTFATPDLYNLIQDLKDTMLKEGGVGIAAPQIGVRKRVIIFGFESSLRYPNEGPVPHTVLINPVIEFISDDKENGWEACLSVPELRGRVSRFTKIKYSGYDPEGNPICHFAEGFHARIVQHEVDHLDGILFPERIENMKHFGFEKELLTSFIKL